MSRIDKRLAALEHAAQAQPVRRARFTNDLMLCYATPEERATWEAAGRPATDWKASAQALDKVYAEAL